MVPRVAEDPKGLLQEDERLGRGRMASRPFCDLLECSRFAKQNGRALLERLCSSHDDQVLGSVSYGVVHNSERPVLIVPPA